MSTPLSAVGAASLTHLPPSPEATTILQGGAPSHLSLEDTPIVRLRSVARYATFQPCCIACSVPLRKSYTDHQGGSESKLGKKHDKQEPTLSTSVAAVAGPQGVALFGISRPHRPLVVLSHASSKDSTSGSVSCLKFQPHTNDSLLLAAARGSGVLVWDASGHSLSPLMGRVAMEPTSSSSERITSVCWMPSPNQALLATTNAVNACIWDLRTALRASHSARPTLRLGNSRKINGGVVVDPLVQISASTRDQVATLDATGNVHVFDVRMTDRLSQGTVGELSSFSSFSHLGIGLDFLPINNEDIGWVTWGLDAPQSEATVKVWSENTEVDVRTTSDADSYWFMDGSPQNSPTPSSILPPSTKSIERQYQQKAQFSTSYLACARVTPEPFENQIVVVGIDPSKDGKGAASGWHAEVWKLNNESSKGDNGYFGVEKITSFDTRTDESILGKQERLGSLRGAELALETSHDVQRLVRDGGLERADDKEDGVDLLLCCLSDNGYVTTHMVFETSKQDSNIQERERRTGRQLSPRVVKSRQEKQLAYSDTTRVYNEDGAGRTVNDAASMLNAGPASGIATNESLSSSAGVSNLQYFRAGHDESLNVSLETEANTTQFDLDFPSDSYGPTAQGPVASTLDVTETVSPPLVLVSSEDDAVEIGIQRTNFIGAIDKERVPCPRLCGGSFSPGLGGIVCFRNGEVRKMWSWYEQLNPKRRVHPAETKDSSSSVKYSGVAEGSKTGASTGDGQSVFVSAPQEVPQSRQECPRTLQDLEDMMNRARSSQWLSDESSGEGSYIDDQSDESVEESASGDEEDVGDHMYQKYFGGARPQIPVSPKCDTDTGGDSVDAPTSPIIRQRASPSGVRSGESPTGRAFLSPTSDLVPAVFITHEHDDLVFSGQGKELAHGWVLGEWENVEEAEEAETERQISEAREEKDSIIAKDTRGGDEVWKFAPSDTWLQSGEYSVPLENKKPQRSPTRIPQVRSDPMLVKLAPPREQQKGRYSVVSDDDPVHAGAYSRRPNRNESLVFLKKLVQRDQLQTLMSPPDSPLLPNKMPFARGKRSTSSDAVMQTPSPTSVVLEGNELEETNHAGVYNLTGKRRRSTIFKRRHERLRDACLHNAEMCLKVDQMDKGNVWSSLAQISEGLLEDDHDNFDGWVGGDGESLGRALVDSFLKYYESQGDVQMLATMACVLRGAKRSENAEGCALLPSSYEDRFDAYIRRYSDVLYGWRLMSIRAEVNKHLHHRLPGSDSDYAALDLVVWCRRCHQEALPGTGICRQCRNYAFSCSICDIAVRGLFTVCLDCGHGGHSSHIHTWFETHSMCPTGCGCTCVLTTPAGTPESQAALLKPMHENVETPELLIAGSLPFSNDVEVARSSV